MNKQRCFLLPAGSKIDDRPHVLFVGRHEITRALEGNIVHIEQQMSVGLDDARPVKGLFLRHQADHLARLVPYGHFADTCQGRNHDHGHAPTLRFASISAKRSQKSRCASSAGTGSIKSMSRVMPRGWPKNFCASAGVKPARTVASK